MSFAFDTLRAAQRLNAAGFSEEQAASLATTFAEGITENLATKDDIVLVHKEVEVLGKDIKALDTKIDTSINKLRGDMTIRLGGIVVGGITALKVIENILAN